MLQTVILSRQSDTTLTLPPGTDSLAGKISTMPTRKYPADTFGDRFDINHLPLPRPAIGYAVQLLNTDQLLDRQSQAFLAVRTPGLDALHEDFDAAYASAQRWTERNAIPHDEHCLAIVPVGYDEILQRPILIYGVLCGQP